MKTIDGTDFRKFCENVGRLPDDYTIPYDNRNITDWSAIDSSPLFPSSYEQIKDQGRKAYQSGKGISSGWADDAVIRGKKFCERAAIQLKACGYDVRESA